MTSAAFNPTLILSTRSHDVDEIVNELRVAISQSLPTDDQIIMEHVRAALVLAESLQRQLRQTRAA